MKCLIQLLVVFHTLKSLFTFYYSCSSNIETVVGKENGGVQDTVLCEVCQMAVIWMQNQLRQAETKEVVLQYVDKVTHDFYSHYIIFYMYVYIYTDTLTHN